VALKVPDIRICRDGCVDPPRGLAYDTAESADLMAFTDEPEFRTD
jgi:hypothetical protein